MKLFGNFPVTVSNSIPKDEIHLIPDDVKAWMDLSEAAATMLKHRIIPEELYFGILSQTLLVIRKAALERRTAVIKNVKF